MQLNQSIGLVRIESRGSAIHLLIRQQKRGDGAVMEGWKT